MPIWAVFGVSWNILSGYGGQLSFGHASFFGIGAYTVTLRGGVLGPDALARHPARHGARRGSPRSLIGMPTFRLRGHYFALAMLAYPLAILYVLQYLGFQEVSMPMHRDNPAAYMEFTDPRVYTLVAVGLLVGGVVVSLLVENSRFGLALLAIRQNELAAEAAGINARLWKMRALVVSGMMAAAAGGFYACVLLVVTPDSVFGMLASAQAVVVTLFGGVASVWGPVIGAAILVPLADDAERRAGQLSCRASRAWCTASRSSRSCCCAGRAVLDGPRPLVPPAARRSRSPTVRCPLAAAPRARPPPMRARRCCEVEDCRARSAGCARSAR